jgi:hypothetical protein
MFKANQQFAQKLVAEGYTVISLDLGNSSSQWFNMEFQTISKGYSGIKFFGAQGGNINYINFIIFEQSTVNTAIKGSINPISW